MLNFFFRSPSSLALGYHMAYLKCKSKLSLIKSNHKISREWVKMSNIRYLYRAKPHKWENPILTSCRLENLSMILRCLDFQNVWASSFKNPASTCNQKNTAMSLKKHRDTFGLSVFHRTESIFKWHSWPLRFLTLACKWYKILFHKCHDLFL